MVAIPRRSGEPLQEALQENQRRARPPIPPRSNDLFVDSHPTIGLRMSSGNIIFLPSIPSSFFLCTNCFCGYLWVKSATIHHDHPILIYSQLKPGESYLVLDEMENVKKSRRSPQHREGLILDKRTTVLEWRRDWRRRMKKFKKKARKYCHRSRRS